MTPEVEAAASSLCQVRPGHPGYCLTHRHVVAAGHTLCGPVEAVVARIVAAALAQNVPQDAQNPAQNATEREIA